MRIKIKNLCVLCVLCGSVVSCSPMGSGAANQVTPVATVAPAITAGDIKEIKQEIKQVQKTITTTNYALDSERAKIETKRIRTAQVSELSIKAVLVGLIIFGLVAPSFLPERYKVVGYIVAVGIIVGAIMLPFLWPF